MSETLGDAVGAAFAVLECAIERGTELQNTAGLMQLRFPTMSMLSCALWPVDTRNFVFLIIPRKRLAAQTMLRVPKRRGVQRWFSESSVARLINAIFIVNATSSILTFASTKQGPRSDSATSGRRLKLSTNSHGSSRPTRMRNRSKTQKGNIGERCPRLTARPRR